MSWPILSEIWYHHLSSLYDLTQDNVAIYTRVTCKEDPSELAAFVNRNKAQRWYNIKQAHVVVLG